MRTADETRALAGPAGAIRIEGAGPLWPILRTLAPAWPDALAEAAVATVRAVRRSEGWRIASTAYAAPAYAFADGFEAASGLLGAALGTWVACGGDRLALHAAAVEFGGRLVLLLGDNFAGKSTLAVALAARGARLWADDRIVLLEGPDGPQGETLALRPKLRLPLPAEADAATLAFVAARQAALSPDVVCLRLGPAEAPAFAASAPVGRLYALARDPARSLPPAATPVGRGEATRLLLAAGFAPQLDGAARLARTLGLAERLPLRRLAYRDSFAAAEWLLREEAR